MNKNLFLSIIIFVVSLSLSATDIKPIKVDTFFTESDKARVLNGEIITRMCIKYDEWGENTDLSINIPRTEYVSNDFSTYEMISDEKAFIPYKLTDESKLKFFNTLTSYSKLQGMKYYSRRIDEVLELIVSASRIQSAMNRKKIADPIYDTVLPKTTNYFLQQDNKFGKQVFRSEVFNVNDGNDFILVNTCTHPIVYVVAVNRKEEFKSITYFMYDKEKEGYFYYSANPIKIRVDLALKKLSPTTFSNRLRATTVHFAKLLGLDWEDKYNAWDQKKLESGGYRNY